MEYKEMILAFLSGFSVAVALSAELQRRLELSKMRDEFRRLNQKVDDVSSRLYRFKLQVEREKAEKGD